MRSCAGAGDDRAEIDIVAGGIGADLQLFDAGTSRSISASAVFSPTGTATEIAMQRSPAAPIARADQRIRRLVQIGIGHDQYVVLAPPKHCARLPFEAARP